MGITGVVSRVLGNRSSCFLSLSLSLKPKYKTLFFFSRYHSCYPVLSIHPLYPVNPFFVRENFIIKETWQCCLPCSVLLLKLVCPAPVPRISCYHFHNCRPDTGAPSGLRTKLHRAVPLPRQLSDSGHSQLLELGANPG